MAQSKKKNMFQEKDPTVFLFGSMVTLLHLVLPFVKILSRLGTVKLQTEDKSFLVLSPEFDKQFERGNITFAIRDEPLVYEDPAQLIDPEFRFNVMLVQEHVPDVNVDMYFLAHPVTFFKNQITLERRHVPLFVVHDLKQHAPELRRHIVEDIFIHETQLQAKSFVAFEPLIYQYTDVHKYDGAMPDAVVTVLYSLFRTFTRFSRSDLVKIFKEELFNANPHK